jgi:hypothetical protein
MRKMDGLRHRTFYDTIPFGAVATSNRSTNRSNSRSIFFRCFGSTNTTNLVRRPASRSDPPRGGSPAR